MRRRIGIGLSAVVLVLATVDLGVAHAVPQPVLGTQHCTLVGREKFKPALSNSGTATTLTARLFVKLSDCTGTTGVAGVTITGGTLRASGTTANFSNACSALAAEGLPGLQGMIRWKDVGRPVQPSTLDVSNGSATIGAAITLESPSPGPTPSEGGSFISGSYGASFFPGPLNNDVVDLHLVADQTPSQFDAACAGKRGLDSFTFTGLNGPSTLSLLPHPPPTVTVTPSTGLVDGQQVSVTGDDYGVPQVEVLQCSSDAQGPSFGACGAQNQPAFPVGVDQTSEHFITSIQVLRTQPRLDNRGTLDCSAPHSCVILAFDPTIRGPFDVSQAPIEFAPLAG